MQRLRPLTLRGRPLIFALRGLHVSQPARYQSTLPKSHDIQSGSPNVPHDQIENLKKRLAEKDDQLKTTTQLHLEAQGIWNEVSQFLRQDTVFMNKSIDLFHTKTKMWDDLYKDNEKMSDRIVVLEKLNKTQKSEILRLFQALPMKERWRQYELSENMSDAERKWRKFTSHPVTKNIAIWIVVWSGIAVFNTIEKNRKRAKTKTRKVSAEPSRSKKPNPSVPVGQM